MHKLGLAGGDVDLMASNLLSRPDRVALPVRLDTALGGGASTFPPHAITVLSMPVG